MNRIVLIGNGFDLAHGLKTNYADFINWYWDELGKKLLTTSSTHIVSDVLCSLTLNPTQYYSTWHQFWAGHYIQKEENPYVPWKGLDIIKIVKENSKLFRFNYNGPFFRRINNNIEKKGWVDIENEYYELLKEYSIKHYSEENIKKLNEQLDYLQERLIEYLKSVNQKEEVNENIKQKIYAPINFNEVSIEATKVLREHIDMWKNLSKEDWAQKLYNYGITNQLHANCIMTMEEFIKNPEIQSNYPLLFMLPDRIMLLSFNYTNTAQNYMEDRENVSINYIHGKVDDKTNNVIFGYGDELDEKYKEIQNLNNNECLRNVKSIKYLESDNYRKVLEFAESAPFQVCIMGHSCGNSDRTLLNTLFEHKNCISIKPYYKKDDIIDKYLELVQNISRNFTDMKLMRDRVVNKTYCETLT